MYRYYPKVPNIAFNPDGWVELYCPPDAAPWEKLTWERWGSGSDYDARHLFVDDWRLEHLWRRQEEGLAKVICQGIVTAPDYTVEHDFPLPLVEYQIWRSRILAKYWQKHEAIVVPALQWGGRESFPLCTKGIRKGSVVAVRGPQKGTENKWLEGMNYMLRRIEPSLILHFGRKIEYPGKVLNFPLRQVKRNGNSANFQL